MFRSKLARIATVAMACCASATAAMADGITVDYAGITTGVTAQVTEALTAALPVLGALLGIAIGVKIYKKFAK